MLAPGAIISTQDPKLAQLGIMSEESDADTQMTLCALAGEPLQASAPEFPAPTTTTIPILERASTASFRFLEKL
jgi:hypothetical protein